MRKPCPRSGKAMRPCVWCSPAATRIWTPCGLYGALVTSRQGCGEYLRVMRGAAEQLFWLVWGWFCLSHKMQGVTAFIPRGTPQSAAVSHLQLNGHKEMRRKLSYVRVIFSSLANSMFSLPCFWKVALDINCISLASLSFVIDDDFFPFSLRTLWTLQWRSMICLLLWTSWILSTKKRESWVEAAPGIPENHLAGYWEHCIVGASWPWQRKMHVLVVRSSSLQCW